jgi:hypothetical protein
LEHHFIICENQVPMSSSISITIEGPDANRALDELLAITGIVGEARARPGAASRVMRGGGVPDEWVRGGGAPAVRGEVTRDGGLLAAVGAIVGLVGGVAPVVSSIIDWRDKWKKAHQDRRLSVVIQDAKGNRISLDDATPEEIAAMLKTLQA